MLMKINPNPKLIIKREKGTLYSVSSWDGKFYNHTNKDAEDFKIDVSDRLGKSRIGKYLHISCKRRGINWWTVPF